MDDNLGAIKVTIGERNTQL